MPKGTEPEQDQAPETPLPSENSGKQISKKELGRLRSKQAVLAKLQANEGDDTKEPQTKKTKSEQGNLEDDHSSEMSVQ